jgi:hypothetical protein
MTEKPDLRHELKLVAPTERLAQVYAWIRLHPAAFKVTYPPRRVNSLYFDSPDLHNLQANLVGLSSRSKLRLRWYGEALPVVSPVLELKYRRNALGGKQRYLLPEHLDLSQTWRQIMDQLRSGSPALWQQFLSNAGQPVLFNYYRRHYYQTPDGRVRLTVDHCQRAHDQRLRQRPNLKHILPVNSGVIIELKASPEQAERLEELVSKLPIRRSRNSKYVNAAIIAL